ncbi:hypothetical protein B5M09_009451 [Aphanomyces astaci]|uniref:rRNA adenine N(6)-methyltransferase n=1 Tax=Aphanomyces astaci TaxID=112090 RepID=A0A3R7Y602_APHAT|nr:hypothetical protein B5M09_009451 [Aphanomyces astaci]
MLLRSCFRRSSMAIPAKASPFATVSSVRVENTPSLKRSLGQHLLVNTSVLQSIVDAAEIHKSDHVLEVGPGTGNLTLLLLGVAKRVEYDHRMIAQLEERFAAEIAAARLKIVHGDFAKMSMASLPKFDLCVANIPYNISSPVVGQLLGKSPHPRFRGAVLMVQEEFALRLMATLDTFLRIAFQRKNKTLRSQLTSKFAAPFLRVASKEDTAAATKEIVLSTLTSLGLLDTRAVKLTGSQFIT